MRGGRRPFCVPVRDLRWELHERDLFLEFFLPKGSYATTFLREIIKEDTPPPVYYGQDAGSATPAAPAGGDSEAGAEPADDDPEDV
jgi:hypothetical protein